MPSRRGLSPSRLALLVALAILPAACGGANGSPVATSPTDNPTPVGTPEQVAAATDPVLMSAPHSMMSGYGRYLAGRQAQFNEDTAGAADNYLAALAHDPNNPLLVRRAWFFLLAEGRTSEALDIARQSIRLDPDSTVAPLVVAAGQAKDGKWTAGLDTLKGLEPVGLNSFLLPLTKAWLLQGAGRTDEAVQALASMKALRQLEPLYEFHVGLIYDVAGRPAQAWPHYQKVIGGAEDDITLRAVQVVADHLRRSNRGAEGEALFNRYRASHQGSELIETAWAEYRSGKTRPVKDAREGLAEALYGSATSVAQTQSFDTAQAFVRLALMLRPDFPFAEMMVGDLLFRQNRFEDAAKHYAGIAKGSPVWFPVRLKLAEAYQELKRHDEARRILRDLAKEYPHSADPLTDLGELERRQEKWDAAEEAYRQALTRLGPPQRQHWPVYYSLGITLERAKKWPQAEQAFRQALALEKDQPMVLNYLGYSWIDRGMNLEEGKALIERAVAQRPTDGYIVDSLGWALYLLGDYPGAVRELERAVVLKASDPTINDHLGDALWRVGRELEARFQWQRALDLKPEAEEVEKIRRKLRDGMPPLKKTTP